MTQCRQWQKFSLWIIPSLILSQSATVSYAQNKQCSNYMWKCSDGQCIPNDLVCDGVRNCADGSDETINSCGHLRCPKFSYRCAYGACVRGDARCNDKNECADNSDEVGCSTTSVSTGNCRTGTSQCDSGQCIPSESVCDGRKDCSDGSDEVIARCSNINCPAYAFRCLYGACINGNAKCNGKVECADGSDEVSQICNRIGIDIPDSGTLTPTTTERIDTVFQPLLQHCILPYVQNLMFRNQKTNEILEANDYMKHNQKIVYECQQNFQLSRNNINICLNGSWAEAHPTCSKPQPSMPSGGCKLENIGNVIVKSSSNGQIISPEDSAVYGESIEYSCPSKHALYGDSENICLNGKFIKNHPTCLRKCSNQVLRGQTFVAQCTYKGLTIPCDGDILPGTRATISCQVGYKKPNRAFLNDILLCDSYGQWDYHPYSCEPDCGTEYFEGRPYVAGGEVTNITMVPWHVIIYQYKDDMYSHICGGTIINAKLVISAAHCFWDTRTETASDVSNYQVVVGKFYRSYNANEARLTQAFNLSEIHIPPVYKDASQSYQNDIALLVLNNYIQFRNHIKPICMEFSTYSKRDLPANIIGRVAGWGKIYNNGPYSEELRSVELPAIEHNECLRTIIPRYRSYVNGEKFCVGSPDDQTVCSGDSGGGFVVGKSIENITTFFLWGVLSVSLAEDKNNCKAGHFTSFTNIQYHKDMIVDYDVRFRPK